MLVKFSSQAVSAGDRYAFGIAMVIKIMYACAASRAAELRQLQSVCRNCRLAAGLRGLVRAVRVQWLLVCNDSLLAAAQSF